MMRFNPCASALCPAFFNDFTGKERDQETGLDNFKKRYLSSPLGRFMSPDPIAIMKQKLRDPQQLNAYTYARNNPLAFVDPLGLYTWKSICDERQDSVCHKNREQFRKDVDRLKYAMEQFKKGLPERTRLERAYNQIGGRETEGKSGPAIAFGEVKTLNGGNGNAETTRDGKNMAFDMSSKSMKNDNLAAGVLAEEGTHSADSQDPKMGPNYTGLSAFQYEFRGNQAQAWALQKTFPDGIGLGGITIYDPRVGKVSDEDIKTSVIRDYGYAADPIYDPWSN
jgi:RHS repeat-associated protein